MSASDRNRKSNPPITIAEALTLDNNEAYTGNPAAIVTLEFDDDIDDETKQKLAGTMNLSETAFVSKGWMRTESGAELEKHLEYPQVLRRTLRWFTPAHEIQLCGHATVATVKTILSQSEGERQVKRIEFVSKFRGALGATIDYKNHDDDCELITLDFPSNRFAPVAMDSPWLSKLSVILLGSQGSHAHFKDVQYCAQEKLLLVNLQSSPDGDSNESIIKRITPDFGALAQLTGDDENGAYQKTGGLHIRITTVTIQADNRKKRSEGAVPDARQDESPHFYTRVFAPYFGVTEDPVCGSAHTIVAPYWAQQLNSEPGRILKARHASERGGDIFCGLVRNELDNSDRVTLGGRARILLSGHLNL